MPERYEVSELTKAKLEQLIADRGHQGGAGGPWPVRQLASGKARWIAFTLPSALATSDSSKASCTVNSYWAGPNPGSTVTVYNLPASSNYIFSGASGHKGLATYDEVNDKYWIVQVECP